MYLDKWCCVVELTHYFWEQHSFFGRGEFTGCGQSTGQTHHKHRGREISHTIILIGCCCFNLKLEGGGEGSSRIRGAHLVDHQSHDNEINLVETVGLIEGNSNNSSMDEASP